MSVLRYISCFSGIGGLEASEPPLMYCESDPSAASVLRALYPDVEVKPDIESFLDPPEADVVAGGWPCQDLSIAGKQAGLRGLRSRLLLEMLRVAESAGAAAVVAENVPNLLKMRGGEEFYASCQAFKSAGYPFVAWRVVNAREFGLPQNRSRLLLVASASEEGTWPLFRPLPALSDSALDPATRDQAAGFYWTGGTHSINFTKGYVPAIKVGSGLGIASPPAVLYRQNGREIVRLVTPKEALRLQGFPAAIADAFLSSRDAYRAAGNAVARPIGQWLLDGMSSSSHRPLWSIRSSDPVWQKGPPPGGYRTTGLLDESGFRCPPPSRAPRATNLFELLDRDSEERLSGRAARGLLSRLNRSGHACPEELRRALVAIGEEALASRK